MSRCPRRKPRAARAGQNTRRDAPDTARRAVCPSGSMCSIVSPGPGAVTRPSSGLVKLFRLERRRFPSPCPPRYDDPAGHSWRARRSRQAPASQPHNIVSVHCRWLRFPTVTQHRPNGGDPARGVSAAQWHALFRIHHGQLPRHGDRPFAGRHRNFSTRLRRFRSPGAGNSLTPFLESDAVLAMSTSISPATISNEATILKLRPRQGYSTASVGKIGPR